MTGFVRLAPTCGSLLANAALLLAFQLSDPPGDRWRARIDAWGHPGEPPDLLRPPWRPFIENAGREAVGAGGGKPCARPEGLAGAVRLDEAPLPSGYDPNGYPEMDIFACVRVDGRGRVLAAHLIGAVDSRTRARLLRAIHRQWRFGVESFAPSAPTWQRVRLDSGPPDWPLAPRM